MAHCPFEKLEDLVAAFTEIRAWPEIREPKPGIFYFKSKPFLHFHIKDAFRWADVRSDGDWERIDAPIPLPRSKVSALLKRIKEHYRRMGGRQ